MTITRRFKSVKTKFVLSIVMLAILSVASFGLVLYEANTITLNKQVSSNDLSQLVQDSPAVAEYLEQEKDYEAHFISIANLVKEEQQQVITRALFVALIPALIIVTLIAYLIANYLLKPVKESFESQERFMQDAAHELRNPLAAISVALDNTPANQSNTNLVTTLRRQTKRLVNIVEDMLFLERRKPGDKISDNNVSELLKDVIEDLTPSINSKNLKVISKIEDDLVINIDSQDFIKLSRNLIENAIKYSKDGKKIFIELVKDGKLKLTIKDNGIGIPESELNNVGERFYRAKNVGKTTGTGLGVAIVQKVLNTYGGSIKIQSQVNKGTTVTVRL